MSDYHGAEEAMLDLWVHNRLSTYTPFNALFPGLTNKVFNRLATPGTTFPYIIYQAQSPPEVVRGVGDAEVMVDSIYIVKVIAQGTNYEPIVNVASGIRTALLEPNGEDTTGGVIFTSRYERAFSMVEYETTKQYRHLGGEFRIQAQAS